MYSFPSLEPVCCSISGSNCCFLICMRFLWRQVRWSGVPISWRIFHSLIVIHTIKWTGKIGVLPSMGSQRVGYDWVTELNWIVKGFSIVNEEVDVFFCNYLSFSMIQQMLAIWPLVHLPFLNPTWKPWISQSMYCGSLAWRILSIALLVCEMSATVQ